MEFADQFKRLVTILIFVVVGLGIIASGQMLLAVREIALNTRKEDSLTAAKYGVLQTIAQLNAIFGWLTMIGGAIFALL